MAQGLCEDGRNSQNLSWQPGPSPGSAMLLLARHVAGGEVRPLCTADLRLLGSSEPGGCVMSPRPRPTSLHPQPCSGRLHYKWALAAVVLVASCLALDGVIRKGFGGQGQPLQPSTVAGNEDANSAVQDFMVSGMSPGSPPHQAVRG